MCLYTEQNPGIACGADALHVRITTEKLRCSDSISRLFNIKPVYLPMVFGYVCYWTPILKLEHHFDFSPFAFEWNKKKTTVKKSSAWEVSWCRRKSFTGTNNVCNKNWYLVSNMVYLWKITMRFFFTLFSSSILLFKHFEKQILLLIKIKCCWFTFFCTLFSLFFSIIYLRTIFSSSRFALYEKNKKRLSRMRELFPGKIIFCWFFRFSKFELESFCSKFTIDDWMKLRKYG